MALKYLIATVAVGTALSSTPAPAMPTSNLAAVAPSMTDNVRYCRYRGCGRVYVRRYVPSYSYYDPYYVPYAYGPSYGAYGFGAPGISFGLSFGRGFGGWGRRGHW